MWTANEHASWRHPFSQNKTNLFQLLTKNDKVDFPPPGNRVRKVYLFLSKKNFLRAEKSKSLIRWKRLKGGFDLELDCWQKSTSLVERS